MSCIYGYQNKVNQKWYVGQTRQHLKERDRQHKSSAINKNSKDYNSPFHRALRKYGENQFELFVLEEVEEQSLLDSREQYWIREKESFSKGYNATNGGQLQRGIEDTYFDSRCPIQSSDQLDSIIKDIKNPKLSVSEIAEKHNISKTLISMINNGKRFFDSSKTYPLRIFKRDRVNSEEMVKIVEMLKNNCTNQEIAEYFNIDPNIIYRINYGKAYRQADITYPIRKELSTKEKRALHIKRLLIEGQLNNKQIAELVGIDPSQVSNINYGKAYKDENLNYPLRKNKPVSTIHGSVE